jgi:hypothetical protein
MAWVEEYGPQTNPDYSVLDYIARHASDHKGVDVAYCFPGINTLAQKSRWERKTVMDAITRLEQQGWLLVQRPSDRGSGRHSEYVILMGREPQVVADKLGWACRYRSVPGTCLKQTPPDGAGATEPDTVEVHRDPDGNDAHRGAQAAPPADPDHEATAPVDNDSAPSDDRSVSGTDPPRTGPGPVLDRSAQDGPEVENLRTTPTGVCSRTSPSRARGSAAVDIELFEELQTALAPLAPTTRWDLTDRDLSMLRAHISTWPDASSAIADFVQAATSAIDELGPPNSARGWRARWLGLTPPGALDGETLCTAHQLTGYPAVPTRACAECRSRTGSPR